MTLARYIVKVNKAHIIAQEARIAPFKCLFSKYWPSQSSKVIWLLSVITSLLADFAFSSHYIHFSASAGTILRSACHCLFLWIRSAPSALGWLFSTSTVTHATSSPKSGVVRTKINFSDAPCSTNARILVDSFAVDRLGCRISVVAVPQKFWVAAPFVDSEVFWLESWQPWPGVYLFSQVRPYGHFTSTGAWLELVYFTSSSLYSVEDKD
jgi:hypothetical protein